MVWQRGRRGDDRAPAGRLGAPSRIGSRVARRLSARPRRSEPAAVAAAFALATAALALTPLINAAPAAPVGRAPAFTIATPTGSSYSLASDLGVRPLLVEFMHPDCSHCQNAAPVLKAAHDRFGSSVRFVTVAIRLGGFADPTPAAVADFASRYGHTWTYGIDEGTFARDLYGVRGTPTFVFIDGGGAVARTQPGEMSEADLDGALAAVSGA